MKKQRVYFISRLFAFGLSAALMIAGISCQNRESEENGRIFSADEEYLKNAGAEWDKLFNARDVSALSSLYSEDAVSMPFNAPDIRGRKAIQTEFENLFAQMDSRHETRFEELLIEKDRAIERARYTMTLTPRNGGKQTIETGRHVMCRKKVDGKWLIVWEIWNSDQPLPK